MGDGSATMKLGEGWAHIGQQLGENSLAVIKRVLRRSEKEAGQIWIDAIKARVPVDTGRLEESITYKTEATPEGMTLHVGPGPEGFYLLFQEFGTRFQEAQPSMRPAVEETADQVLERLGQVLMEELQTLEEQKSQFLEIAREQLFGS
jgi:HK97 gp10 family phage protein